MSEREEVNIKLGLIRSRILSYVTHDISVPPVLLDKLDRLECILCSDLYLDADVAHHRRVFGEEND